MQVILLEKIRNLGDLGETVDVKPGYARNFLVPEKKAVFATEENVTRFESQRADLEKKAKTMLEDASKRAAELEGVTLKLSAQASEQGKLYGSIGISEIRDAFLAQSLDVSRREIIIPEGRIFATGEYDIEVHVHSDVIATVKLEITAA